jgi:hypothetical protein
LNRTLYALPWNRTGTIEVLLDVELKLDEPRALVELASFVNCRTESD